jgi:hypothetical protein
MQTMIQAHAPGTKQPLPEHQRLRDLAGEWRIEGHNLNGAPDKPGGAVTGHSTFHWLPGKFFVSGRESVSFDGQTHTTLMVFAYLADLREYRAYFFDNAGFSREYAGKYENRTWRFTGRYERVRIDVSEDGSKLRHFWERTEGGDKWEPLCELTSHRID